VLSRYTDPLLPTCCQHRSVGLMKSGLAKGGFTKSGLAKK
jgi:hypothetical protein